MIEVVYKHCNREVILSDAGVTEYVARKYGGTAPVDFMVGLIPRDDAVLVAMVKENNPDFINACADTRIDQLPDGSIWIIKGGNRMPEAVAVIG